MTVIGAHYYKSSVTAREENLEWSTTQH